MKNLRHETYELLKLLQFVSQIGILQKVLSHTADEANFANLTVFF